MASEQGTTMSPESALSILWRGSGYLRQKPRDAECACGACVLCAWRCLAALHTEIGRLRAGLEDFRDHGTRHDLHPTLMGYALNEEALSPGGRGWDTYLKSMDDYVRQKAGRILLDAEKGETQ